MEKSKKMHNKAKKGLTLPHIKDIIVMLRAEMTIYQRIVITSIFTPQMRSLKI